MTKRLKIPCWSASQWGQVKLRATLASMAQNGCKSGANGSCPTILLRRTTIQRALTKVSFDGIMKAIVEDRPAYFSEFFKAFFNVDVLLGKRISNEAIQASWNVAVGSSAKRLGCVPSWLTDFRDDLPIDVNPDHHSMPIAFCLESTAARLPKLIKVNWLSFLVDRTPSTGLAIRLIPCCWTFFRGDYLSSPLS